MILLSRDSPFHPYIVTFAPATSVPVNFLRILRKKKYIISNLVITMLNFILKRMVRVKDYVATWVDNGCCTLVLVDPTDDNDFEEYIGREVCSITLKEGQHIIIGTDESGVNFGFKIYDLTLPMKETLAKLSRYNRYADDSTRELSVVKDMSIIRWDGHIEAIIADRNLEVPEDSDEFRIIKDERRELFKYVRTHCIACMPNRHYP